MADSKIFVLHAREVNGAPHDAPPVYGDATEMVRVLELWMSCSRPPRSIVVMPCFAEQQWRMGAGERWCSACKAWHPREMMIRDRSRRDGVGYRCKSRRVLLTPEERRSRKNARYRDYYARNRERIVAQKRDRRGVPRVPDVARALLSESYDGRCAYCGGEAGTWDHVVPVVKGGETVPGNIVPACTSCNSSKKDADVFEWLERKGLPGTDAFACTVELGGMA